METVPYYLIWISFFYSQLCISKNVIIWKLACYLSLNKSNHFLLFANLFLLLFQTVSYFKGDFSGVYSIDHYLKTGRAKKENILEFKILFALGKTLFEADISL